MDDTWIGCKRPPYGRKHPQMMDSGKRVGKRRRSVACKVSDIGRCRQSPVQFGHFLVCVFQPPEGRTENSPGLQAWEGLRKENRPERAADFRALFSRDNLRQKQLDGISETNLFWYKNLRAQFRAKETRPSNVTTTYFCVPGQSPFRTPLQGDSLVRVIPRAEALGYPLIARRATAKCPNSSARCKQRSSNVHEDRSRTGSER
jgi:hypothetical protein